MTGRHESDQTFGHEDKLFEVGIEPTALPTQNLSVEKHYQIVSPYPADTDISEAMQGADLLGLGLFKQGEQIAGVCNATHNNLPLYDTIVIEMSRRSAKTTSIFALLLGRLLNRPGYKVVFTAQDGTRARAKFRNDIMLPLEQSDFEGKGLGKLFYSNGGERIELTNGSRIWVVPPDPGAFRGDAADVIFVDEAGELAPEKAQALIAGALPLMDTRPQGQVIIAGTPNTKHRAGLLWTTLEDLTKVTPGVGGVVYAAPDAAVFADLSDPDNPVYDLELLEAVHPGIQCGLTTAAKVLKRIGPMGLDAWCAEYLCQWPRNSAMSALDVDAWTACGTDDYVTPPERVGIAWDVDPDGSYAALVSAWRVNGVAHFEVIDARGGTDWLARKVKQVHTKYKLPIAYDAIGANHEISNLLERAPYKVYQKPLNTKVMYGAVARFDKEIRNKNIVHFNQSTLTRAVEGASWRLVNNNRLFSRKPIADSIAPVVAASEALWIYDEMPANRSRVVVVSG